MVGASGQIGGALLPGLQARGRPVLALSRQVRPALPGVAWHQGDLAGLGPLPGGVETVLSCGPLDHFARWYEAHGAGLRRVVAFGSTSRHFKQASPDPHEQDLVRRLAGAEASLFAHGRRYGAAVTVLRPTLVWGAGMDRSLTRLAALARRSGHVVLPAGATGLRQPVHVADLAAACLAVLDHPATAGRAYDLGGGEVLPYREMVRRVLAVLPRRTRLWSLPPPLLRGLLALARHGGRLEGLTPAVLARMAQDLVVDNGPAARDFGYAPRGFSPSAAGLGLVQ